MLGKDYLEALLQKLILRSTAQSAIIRGYLTN